MTDFSLENDADLAITVLWACATDEDSKFSNGSLGTSVYNNYYATARGAAFVAVSKWLFFRYGVSCGYSKHYNAELAAIILRETEEVLEKMADCGPEPVRALYGMVLDNRIEELLLPKF